MPMRNKVLQFLYWPDRGRHRQTVLYNDGHLTRYTYDADGRKLKTEYILSNFRFAEFEPIGPLEPVFKPMASPLPGGSGGHITIDKDRFPIDSAIYMGPKTLMTVEYCGNHIYRNGKLERILNDYGYYANGAYHFNITDYQDNIRAVIREDGTLEETSSYYPYGGLMGSGSMGVQPYKYGGKELDRENGLDLYDSHARMYDPIIGRTTTIDPLAEKYTHLSPYLWCAANPLKYVDKNGCSITAEIENKEYLIKKNNDTYKLYDKNGNNFIPEEFTFGDYLISDINHLAKSKEGSKIVEYIYYNDRNLTIKKGSSFSFNIAEDVLSYADGNGSQNGGLSSFLFSQLKPDRPHYIGLVHEMAHAEYAWKGFDNKDIWYKNNRVTAFKSELYTMYKENLVRMENNLPLRMFYEHQLIKIGNYDFIMPNWFSKVPLTIKNNIYLLNNLNRR